MAIVMSLINMKGGVGKTTLAAQLAFAATSPQRRLRTLAVDLDPQSNLSQALLTPERYVRHLRQRKPTIVQIFEQYFPPSEESESPRPLDVGEVILNEPTIRPNLDLIVSRLELSHTLKNPHGKERRLARALAQVADDYDLILIDCAPTESILTEAAYHASRYVLVPVKPEFLATIGLPLLARSIQEFKYENADHALDICGIVFNHSSSYSVGPEGRRSIREVQTEARKHGWHVFETQVRYSRSYAKAAREGRPIRLTSNVRWYVPEEFNRFVDEFFERIELTGGEE
ncbi:MAG TPA: ParA family protein [Gemmataceae bacterium]|nr:ParA family protein [Gemmataceae bacterium]